MYTSAKNRDLATCADTAACDGIAIWSDDNTTTVTLDGSWSDLAMNLSGAPCLAMTKGADPEGALTDMSCDTALTSACEFTCATGEWRAKVYNNG
jgi:hypothetical protein